MDQLKNIKERTFTGIGALVLRNFLIQPISFISFFALSVFLEPRELGVYWAVVEVVGFLGYFSDIGLAAALIREKKAPKTEEVRTIFTIQQIIVLTLITITLLLVPFLDQRFDFGESGKFLLYALLFGFFTSSLKTIPSVFLERKLKFKRLAVVDLTEQIVFDGLAVFMAWQGFGASSWIGAVLARSVVGVVLMYIISPWPIGINFNLKSIKGLFNFGIPYQLNSLLAVAKDKLVNIFLWGILGSYGMGIIGWAQKWSQLPLRFLMDSVIRVTFPAYSRLQKNKQRLSRALQNASFFVNLLIFPILAGIGISMPKLISIYPEYQKWSEAVLPLWLYLGNFAFGTATTPLINAFNAIGKVKLNLKFMGMWTILTWLIVPIFTLLFGANGAAAGLLLVSASSIVAWWWVKREFQINLLKSIGVPFILSLTMLISLIAINQVLPDSLIGLISLVCSGGLIYGLLSYIFVKPDLVWGWQSLNQVINKYRK